MSVSFVDLTAKGPWTIDHLKGWVLSEQECDQYGTELLQVQYLGNGLQYLYNTVRDVEKIQPPEIQRCISFSGNQVDRVFIIPGLGDCFFQWYAVSICNYCDLIAAIALDQGIILTKKAKKDYRSEVCERVELFRHKVGAHFSRTWPKEDNQADQRLSVAPQLEFCKGRLWVGKMIIAWGTETEKVESTHDYSWSLTLFHEQLCKRYGKGPRSPQIQ